MRLRSTSEQNWTQHLRSQPTFLVSLLFTIHLHMFALFAVP